MFKVMLYNFSKIKNFIETLKMQMQMPILFYIYVVIITFYNNKEAQFFIFLKQLHVISYQK